MDCGPRIAAAAAPIVCHGEAHPRRLPVRGALLDAALGVPPLGRDVAALVLTTACDQMRYAAAMLEVRGRGPVFLLNLPSTWQTPAVHSSTATSWAGSAGSSCGLAVVGQAVPTCRGSCSTSIVRGGEKRTERERGRRGNGEIRESASAAESPPLPLSPSPLLQSPWPLSAAHCWELTAQFFALVARAGGRVALDGTEGGQRALPRPFDRERVASDPFGELANAYFDGIPDAFRRPNTRLYEWLDRELAASGARGVILRRYVWCDLWHAESQRLKQWSPVPVLEIDVGPEDKAAPNRVQGRIEAFLETLR